MQLNQWAKNYVKAATDLLEKTGRPGVMYRLGPEDGPGTIIKVVPDPSFRNTSFEGHFGALETDGELLPRSIWTKREIRRLRKELGKTAKQSRARHVKRITSQRLRPLMAKS